MVHSIKKQLILRCILLVVSTISISWFVNAFFLENIYINSKIKKLLSMYEVINAFDYKEYLLTDYNDDTTDDEAEELKVFKEELDAMCRRNNINFIITDERSNTVMTSINNPMNFNKLLRDTIFSRELSNIEETLLKEDNYTICNMKDSNDTMEYTVMWGNLDNGDFFMLRTALEGVRDTVKLTNIFMLYVSLGAIVFGCIAIYFVSIKILKPVGELTELSKKMANLDFDAKYEGNSKNEIDVLGQNFNQLSKTLEKTIGQLKSANEELLQDVENKTKVDNMRKEFIANVSHELKTPIALIQGYAEGLKESINDDQESREFYCEVIMDETSKMNKMVKQLMTLNQLEFGGDLPDMTRISITELLNNFVQSSILLSKDKNIELEFINLAGNVCVWSDEYKIEEVIRNYFNNALNHIDDKKQIKIIMSKTDDNVKVSVYNSGQNIPEDSIENLWDKFYKVDKARTREYGGSGIGLSIVKAIMEQLHGEYGVNNKEEGVEFWFTLPLK